MSVRMFVNYGSVQKPRPSLFHKINFFILNYEIVVCCCALHVTLQCIVYLCTSVCSV